MTPSLRILATTSFSIGLLVFGCGGKVLEQDTSSSGGTPGSGAGGGAHKGGSGGDFGTAGVGGGVSAGGSWQAGGSGGVSGNSSGEGACNNPSDLELMDYTAYDYLVLYPAMGDKCWKSCFGDMTTVYECVYACVQKLTGGKLSPACTACHAADSECVAQTCHDTCMTGPLYAECFDCRCGDPVKQKCAAQFLACSGKPNCPPY